MSTRRLIVPLSLACIAAHAFADLGPEARPKIKYTPIVLTGQSAPGGGAFGLFPYHSVINDADQVVFLGAHDNIYAPDALYFSSRSGISLVASKGQAAPGLPTGFTIGDLDVNYHQANTLGQAIFEAVLYGPTLANDGYDRSNWLWSAGKLTNIAEKGLHAPGTPADVSYGPLERSTINDLGQVAFYADLTGPSVNDNNNTAFFFGTPGNIQLLAREGSPGPDGITYGEIQAFDYPRWSSNGKIVFQADRAGGPGYGSRLIVAGTPGDLHVVAQSGQAAPGTNSTFREIDGGRNTPAINDKGEIIFRGLTQDGTRGIWAGTRDNLRLVARTGEEAPVLNGAKFDFFERVGLNNKGDVVFRADFEPGDNNSWAIYAGKASNPQLIAATGQHAPGTEEGVTFRWVTDPVINKDGQVAFFGALGGANSRGPNDYGLFATGHNGDLRLIARYGDDFEVAKGDIRTIQALSYAGINGDHRVSFNADSDLIFLAEFTGGSQGIFTARVLPEPAAALIFLSLSSLLTFRRRSSMR